MKLIICLSFLLISTLAAAASDQATGKVVSLTGTARDITSAQALAVGSTVAAGDTITTGAGSNLRISFDGEVAIQLGENSELLLNHAEKQPWSLRLVSGQLMSAARKVARNLGANDVKLEVKTGNSVMGVRGTVFFVSVKKAEPTFLCVCMGTVEVNVANGRVKKTLVSKHHDIAQLLHDSGPKPKATLATKGVDHTDAEMNALSQLVK